MSLRGGLCPTWQSSFVNDKNSFYSTFCHPKGGAQMCRNRRCGARAEAACRLCRAARRKTMLRRNLGGRYLSSVKRLLRTFDAIKRSSFFNPPPAHRPVSLNFAVREGLTHKKIQITPLVWRIAAGNVFENLSPRGFCATFLAAKSGKKRKRLPKLSNLFS